MLESNENPGPTLAAPAVRCVKLEQGKISGTFTDAEYVFTYTERGICAFRMERRLYRIGPGHAILMPPHFPHALKPLPGSRLKHWIAHFALPAGMETLKHCPLVIQIAPADRRRLQAGFKEMLREWQARERHSAVVLAGLMTSLLGLYLRHIPAEAAFVPVVSKSWANIEAAIAFMHAKYYEPLSVAKISQRAGLSTAYFCKVFHSYTGVGPHYYLNRVRLEKSKELLWGALHNCTEVAGLVGFSSVHVFSKAFTQHVGLSPTQWMRQTAPKDPSPSGRGRT